MSDVRTRFAVSPTGLLHIGAVRSAIFDWLFAQSQKGTLLLRIEDTDKAREIEGGVKNIIESLQWLGIEWQEGPDVGGPHKPYTQSQRLDTYKKYAQELIDKDYAYADPYTTAEVEAFRQKAQQDKRAFLFRDYRPKNPPQWDGSQALRFKVNAVKPTVWKDAVRGELKAGPEALDDIILIKSDGYPTYNFCHIVDDYLMGVTHVLRGEEFIASTPKYLSIYEAFGWKPPVFATLPQILGTTGKKLSKRDGATSLLEYRDRGYLPEAMVNFLALLGWNDGSEQELYTKNDLVEKFTLNRIQKSPAVFDITKLEWMNSQYIKKLWQGDKTKFMKQAEPFLPAAAKNTPSDLIEKILEIEHERLKRLDELEALPAYYFESPSLNVQDLEPYSFKASCSWLKSVIALINESDTSDRSSLERHLRELIGKHANKPGQLFGILRIALTNADRTPPIWDLVYVLGQEETIKRLEKAQALL